MADLFSFIEESDARRRQMLRTAFGPTIAAALADPTVIEVMLNPDGHLWLDKVGTGRIDTGERIATAEAERIIRLVAAHMRREVTDKNPIVSAELPDSGERFEGLIPPISPAPCFAIRKPAEVLYRLDDYVSAHLMSAPQADVLRTAIRDRKNIVVAGGTSSGKTTLVNALNCAAPRPIASPCAPVPASSPSPISSAPPCACAPIASSSARSAVPKPSTC
jgi:type IV secretion system protein TrbB